MPQSRARNLPTHLVAFALGFLAWTMLHSCGVTGPDLEAFSKTQEASNTRISAALVKLGDGVISPAEAKAVVDDAVKTNAAATTATIKKLEDRILSWWDVAVTVALGSLTVTGTALGVLSRWRNSTRETQIEEAIDRRLAQSRLAPPAA